MKRFTLLKLFWDFGRRQFCSQIPPACYTQPKERSWDADAEEKKTGKKAC
jgi:hypothetical protein